MTKEPIGTFTQKALAEGKGPADAQPEAGGFHSFIEDHIKRTSAALRAEEAIDAKKRLR